MRFSPEWTFVGKYCGKHLAPTAEYFGTCKVEALSAENVEVDAKCDYETCKEFVRFGVHKGKHGE